MFTKRCTLSEQTRSGQWQDIAMGEIQVLYDPELYGARICMNADNGEMVSNTIIGINTLMMVSKFLRLIVILIFCFIHLIYFFIIVLFLTLYFSIFVFT